MAKAIMTRFDRIINIVTLFLIAGGGTILHTLTALTLKSYYGSPWGYISFALPGIAEIYLVIIQLADNMYNFTYLMVAFFCLTAVAGSAWFIKNLILQRIGSVLESRS